MTQVVGERSPEDVVAEAHAVQRDLAERSDYRGRQRLQGALDALEWALGNRRVSPLSQRWSDGAPDRVALSQENSWALEVVYATRPEAGSRDRLYAGGVEETLCWVLGLSAEAPVPFGDVQGVDDGPVLVRDAAAIDAAYGEVGRRAAGAQSADDVAMYAGMAHALEWLAGRRVTCPVTYTPGPADAAALDAADERYVFDVAPQLSGTDAAYGNGVGLVLGWALGKSSEFAADL